MPSPFRIVDGNHRTENPTMSRLFPVKELISWLIHSYNRVDLREIGSPRKRLHTNVRSKRNTQRLRTMIHAVLGVFLLHLANHCV